MPQKGHCMDKDFKFTIFKEISSSGAAFKMQDALNLDVHTLAELQKVGIPTTNDSSKYVYGYDGKLGWQAAYSWVVFYILNFYFLTDFEKCTGKILRIRVGTEFVDMIESGQEGALLLDQTCFYAEQGGQIYDTGVLTKIGDEVCKTK